MSVAMLSGIRDRVLPMFEIAAEQYRARVPAGYPVVVDTPEQGVVGLEIDPSYAIYVTSDGADLFAEVYRRSPRTDQRSSAGRQKESGVPFHVKHPLWTALLDDPAVEGALVGDDLVRPEEVRDLPCRVCRVG